MSWWEIKDSRAGVTLALVNASSLNRTEARRIGDRISMVLGGVPLAIYLRTTRPNPTLVHHGIAHAARWHLVTAADHAPVADLYAVIQPAEASRIAHAIADMTRVPMMLVSNRGEPQGGISRHPIVRAASGNLEHRPTPRPNPKRGGRNPRPTTIAQAAAAALNAAGWKAVATQVRKGQASAVEGLTFAHSVEGRAEMKALLKRALDAARRAPNPGGRKGWVLTHIAKGYGRVFISTRLTTDGRADEMFTTDVAEAKVWRTRGEAAAAVKRAKEVWAFGWKWSVAPATTLNPSRGKGARTHRKAKRKAFGSRRVYRAAAATHRPQTPAARAAALAKFGYRMDSHQARTRRRLYRGPSIPGTSRPYSNPGGRNKRFEVRSESIPFKDGRATIYQVFDKDMRVVVWRGYRAGDAVVEAARLSRAEHAKPNPGGRDSTQLAMMMADLRKSRPRSVRQMFGSNGPTPAQEVQYNAQARAWNKEYRALTKAHKAAVLGNPRGAEFSAMQPPPAARRLDALLDRAQALWDAGRKEEAQTLYDKAWAMAQPARNPTYRLTATLKTVRGRGGRARLAVVPRAPRVRAPRGPRVPRARARFQAGERVSVPYTGRESYFGRAVNKTREHATAQGYASEGGEEMVVVHVRRGQGTETHTFPPSAVRRLPRRGASAERARLSLEQIRAEMAQVDTAAHELYPQGGEPPTPEYRAARRRLTKLENELRAREIVASEQAATGTDDPWRNPRGRLRHRRGRITRNPRSEMSRARATARMWSELEPGKITRVSGPKRVPRIMAKLGELVSVVYRSDKYDGKPKLYEHKTRRPRPVLATDPDGRDVFVVGGDMKVTADGLVN